MFNNVLGHSSKETDICLTSCFRFGLGRFLTRLSAIFLRHLASDISSNSARLSVLYKQIPFNV